VSENNYLLVFAHCLAKLSIHFFAKLSITSICISLGMGWWVDNKKAVRRKGCAKCQLALLSSFSVTNCHFQRQGLSAINSRLKLKHTKHRNKKKSLYMRD